MPITDKDHFSVLETLEDGAGVLCQALTQIFQRCVLLWNTTINQVNCVPRESAMLSDKIKKPPDMDVFFSFALEVYMVVTRRGAWDRFHGGLEHHKLDLLQN